MDERGNAVKSEKNFAGTDGAVSGCFAGAVFRDRAAAEAAPVAVETERDAAQETFMPDVSPLNINTASEEELATLPGIGGVLAGRIVDYRTEHGPFEAEEDLLKVSGIGERKLAELDGRITAGG